MTKDKKNSAQDSVQDKDNTKSETPIAVDDKVVPATKMGKLKANIKDTIEYKSRPLEWYYYVGFAILLAAWLYGKNLEKKAQDADNFALNGASKTEVCLEFVKTQSPDYGDFNRATIDGNIITVHQVRGGEGRIFFYDCQINNDGIVWRVNKEDGGMGPWVGSTETPAAKFSVSAEGKIVIN
jgi:hypothetical protein